jgi:hypothetical protein
MHSLIIILSLLLAGCGLSAYETPMPADGAWGDATFENASKSLSRKDRDTLVAFVVRYDDAQDTPEPLDMPATIGDALAAQRAYEQQEAAERARAEQLQKEQRLRLETSVTTRLLSKELEDSRYQKHIAIKLEFTNHLDAPIAGVTGRITILDMFDKPLAELNLSYDKPLQPQTPVEWEGLMPFNQFMARDVALAAAEGSTLKARFQPEVVIMADGTRLEVK